MGNPVVIDINSAIIDTFKDRKIISYRPALKELISSKEFKIISPKAFYYLVLC